MVQLFNNAHMQASKDINGETVRQVRNSTEQASENSVHVTSAEITGIGSGAVDPGAGVVQVYFRISPGLDTRIRRALAECPPRMTKRALWIAAMEAYLGQATEPTGKAGL